ncbi:arylesterase [Sulfurospirillum sp. T05]|uniref:Arylesterase n=1 Tax=Sulfurospirillum tamanense TaxID=2813362 RepID=A0ABS2WTV5_9BACT|nr:GDSL-type esterase/lipase family protein [Sulfurospirillum tamanensis]MBN2965097.1 arylesterase [Sulfurospirillum tamanensis]
MRYILYVVILGMVAYQVFVKLQSLKEELPKETHILAFGDSITFGTGASVGYPQKLAILSGVKVTNAGIPGEVSAQGLARLGQLLETTRPDIVILCHGGNDILRRMDLAQTKANVRQMIALVEASGAKAVLVGVPLFTGIRIVTADIYDALAKETDVVYVPNALTDVIKNGALKSDHVHPNDEGYAHLAQVLYEALLRVTNAQGL